MKLLMLGWEFPPYFAGGVGIVCESLARALARRGVEITYLMPHGPADPSGVPVRLLVASHLVPGIEAVRVPSALTSYAGAVEIPRTGRRQVLVDQGPGERDAPLYGADLLAEVERFAARGVAVVRQIGLGFDVIHAHDWTTAPAALELRRLTGRPLFLHVHITEFDKTGGAHADPTIYAIEREGMVGADVVIAVSERVKRQCVERYAIDPGKIQVVHNAVEPGRPSPEPAPWRRPLRRKLVAFLGRVTLQKGPDYFLRAARRVLDVDPDVTFVLAGSGDMLPRMIERAAELGIGDRCLFTGFLSRQEAARLYGMADAFVMPSVSEPFGIVALEAMSAGVPTIVSRQAGVGEAVRHVLRADFWDVEELAHKILAVLSYPSLARELGSRARLEASRQTWDRAAQQVLAAYAPLLDRALCA